VRTDANCLEASQRWEEALHLLCGMESRGIPADVVARVRDCSQLPLPLPGVCPPELSTCVLAGMMESQTPETGGKCSAQ
jgi:pentatricopeptide repeat protein